MSGNWETTKPTLTNIASGWTVTVVSCFRRYDYCVLTLDAKPSKDPGTGNITNITLCQVPVGFRPVTTVPQAHYETGAVTFISDAGNIQITAIAYPWGTSAARRMVFSYPLA